MWCLEASCVVKTRRRVGNDQSKTPQKPLPMRNEDNNRKKQGKRKSLLELGRLGHCQCPYLRAALRFGLRGADRLNLIG